MDIPKNAKQQVAGNQAPETKKKQTYAEWAKMTYNDQYEKWMPWIEDQYLRWFGKGDNKASYATKDSLSKMKITGIDQVDQIQDDIHGLTGNQISDKGILKPVGQFASKEGINRAERKGRDETGSYGGPAEEYIAAGSQGTSRIGSKATEGVESAQGFVTGTLRGTKGFLAGESGK
ncbi:hypothetical protein N7462_006761 [Penicillium macrosclerotiorum]|uniref:uncharacterized protein n=1 Tax=Penicillium macrosclerotiorum TaxID=303699 RepID=UPI002546A0C7|nr:uncharacterized protein N7462_006761 [Penicillium macrosclerotiorum]KAJ5683596.1 hypothetical protein N7462_006761 [Penicillium macrosclerotiorum]